MPPQPTGLSRDLNLVRRRAWLFIPFLLLGIVVAYVFGSVAGDANAVASLTLDTVIQNVTGGGDRGFRIFEAESMTADPDFKQKVIDRTGEPDFDYSRFSISLSPVSVADGVSRGVLTVSITDPDKAKAEQYREAFVSVFAEEFGNPDGLFRMRFLNKKQEVVDAAEATFSTQYETAKPLAEQADLPLDELIRAPFEGNLSLLDALADAEGQISRDLALARAGDNAAEVQRLDRAREDIQAQRAALSEGNMPEDLRRAVQELRAANASVRDAYKSLTDARTAASSAQSDMEVSYTFSGGLAGSMLGRVAVVIAVTLVFGLIAIYAWEWLSQVRAGVEDRPQRDASSSVS